MPVAALDSQPATAATNPEQGYVAEDAVGIPIGGLLPCGSGVLAHHHEIATDEDSSSSDSFLAEQRGDTKAARSTRVARAAGRIA